MQATRFCCVPEGLVALTATARGMVQHSRERAARQAFGELVTAAAPAGLSDEVASWISLVPDDPQGPDDPHCRYVAGVVFGHALATGQGVCKQPALALSGTLAWWGIAAGRYAAFTHIGSYTTLHRTWAALYRDWLPASGERLRDVPPLQLIVNSPDSTPPDRLHTEIWLPLAD